MPLSVGDKLGPYEILTRLGVGGMGEVWKACDTRLDRIVAVKISQGNFDERFEREARAIAALNHPNICQLYDVGPNYLVMEFVEGSPIAMADNVRKLLDVAVQIADGLAAAHAGGILHRDLKPDNILVTREGRVKVLDFGLAKSLTARPADDATSTIGLTDSGTVVGTVNYMSPEQARGEASLTPQSDQFSFGLVLYELATGKRAFQRGNAPETMTAIIREDAEPLPGNVPAPLRWVIERLLAKEPSERYDSTRDLYRELKQIRTRLSQATSAQTPAAAVSTPKRKRRLVLGAGAVACLTAGSVFALLAQPLACSCSRLIGLQVYSALPSGGRAAFSSMVAGRHEHRLHHARSCRHAGLHETCWHTGCRAAHQGRSGLHFPVLVTRWRQRLLPFRRRAVVRLGRGRRFARSIRGNHGRRSSSGRQDTGIRPWPQVMGRVSEG